MLSRAAERIYWLARYLERAENTARMANAFFHAILDLPRGQQHGWDLLLEITASEDLFESHYGVVSERNVIRFLLADAWNPGSINSSVRAARENARTTREMLTPALWEELNALHLYIQEQGAVSIARRYRYEFLQVVIQHLQRITGLIDNGICRTQGYRFLQLGRYIERADMTTRIVAAGIGIGMRQNAHDERMLAIDNVMWRHLLTSLDALSMYRLRIGPRIDAMGTRLFLLKDVSFPQSVNFSLQEIGIAIRHLPRHRKALSRFSEVQDELINSDVSSLPAAQMLAQLDDLQLGFIGIDETIRQTWFGQARQ